jgi:hypothetical protein
VRLGGWEDDEGEEEEGAEDYAEDGEVIWDAEVRSPVYDYLSTIYQVCVEVVMIVPGG